MTKVDGEYRPVMTFVDAWDRQRQTKNDIKMFSGLTPEIWRQVLAGVDLGMSRIDSSGVRSIFINAGLTSSAVPFDTMRLDVYRGETGGSTNWTMQPNYKSDGGTTDTKPVSFEIPIIWREHDIMQRGTDNILLQESIASQTAKLLADHNKIIWLGSTRKGLKQWFGNRGILTLTGGVINVAAGGAGDPAQWTNPEDIQPSVLTALNQLKAQYRTRPPYMLGVCKARFNDLQKTFPGKSGTPIDEIRAISMTDPMTGEAVQLIRWIVEVPEMDDGGFNNHFSLTAMNMDNYFIIPSQDILVTESLSAPGRIRISLVERFAAMTTYEVLGGTIFVSNLVT
jgi:hypothetical protein